MQKVDLTPDGANMEIGLLLAMLDDATKEWTEELGTVDDEAIIWQPFADGHSIGALMLHIADVEAYWIQQIGAGKQRSAEELKAFLSEETNQYAVQWPAPPAQPLEWYLQQLRRVREATRQTVLAINDPDHIGVRRDTQFTLRWLLSHVISHEAYHGGQAVFLALMHTAQHKVGLM
jgi:uncharacterized damage-inducible protein DinB